MNMPTKRARLVLKDFPGNKTEKAFAEDLALREKAGDIQWFGFEPIKLRLAKSCFYTPDFAVLFSGRTFGFYEVKVCSGEGTSDRVGGNTHQWGRGFGPVRCTSSGLGALARSAFVLRGR